MISRFVLMKLELCKVILLGLFLYFKKDFAQFLKCFLPLFLYTTTNTVYMINFFF